ncbi:hypothetical protein, partial [Bartonella sp. AC134YNZD]|uniref:hypothetical protein n=1 Tax=Bartonella sp. AC134YNZD TaxID=3243446 RepID=UPI0035CF2C6C
AEKARDLYWKLEIAKVSYKAQLAQERQRQAAWEAGQQAQRTITALEQKLMKMEEANGILPVSGSVTGCGIGIERVRLLNTQASG